MKILHLDPDDIDNPMSGGGPVRTLEICRRLARRHEVTVLTPTFDGSTAELWRDGVRYLRLGRKIGDHGSSHHITFLAALPGAVRRHDYDLLVEDTMPPCSTTWTPFFARRDRPLVSSVQWWFARSYTDRLKLPFHWGESLGLRLYRHFVTLTPRMGELIRARRPGANCRVIPNGVDEELFGVPITPGAGLLFIGRLEIRAKGLDLLIGALARITPDARPVLTIAGAGSAEQEQELDALVDRHHLHAHVLRVGRVNAARRLELLQACRFTVMPSRSETFGMTIAESNAAGKVAVIFDQWPMSEVAAPVCPRVPPEDEAALARAISTLLARDDTALTELGEQCRSWSQRYRWDTIAADQEAFYQEVLDQHGKLP